MKTFVRCALTLATLLTASTAMANPSRYTVDRRRPFYAYLVQDGALSCFAAIIGPRFLLTSTRCIENPAPITVEVGENGAQKRNVERVHNHVGQFIGGLGSGRFDIVLLEVDEDFHFGPSVQHVEFATPTTDDALLTAGLKTAGPALRASDRSALTRISPVEWMVALKSPLTAGSEFYADPTSPVDASWNIASRGQPLTVEINGRSLLVGIASRQGDGKSNDPVPSLFTRVSNHVDWICSEMPEESADTIDSCKNWHANEQLAPNLERQRYVEN